MSVKPNEVYLYDSVTGDFKRSFDSQTEMEKTYGFYRGYVREILNGSVIKPKVLISLTKAAKYPGKLPDKEIATNSPIEMFSEDELRKKHDNYFKIISFLKDIPAGKFIDEPTMLRQLSLYGKPRYREALSRPEVHEYRGKADGVVYYGAINSIKKLKNEGVLQ